MKPTKRPAKGQSRTSAKKPTSKNSSPKGEQLQTIEDVPGSPFKYVRHEDQHFLTLGRHRISKIYKTQAGLKRGMSEDSWNIVFNLIASMLEIHENLQPHGKDIPKPLHGEYKISEDNFSQTEPIKSDIHKKIDEENSKKLQTTAIG